jgi:hypothetical protein
MLQGIAGDSSRLGKELPALAMRAAAVFSGIVEVSLPRRPGELLWRYWRSLFYVIGGLLIVVGLIFNEQTVQKGGLLLLLLTGVTHLATSAVELWIVRRWSVTKGVLAGVLAFLLTVIFALGLWQAYALTSPVAARAYQWVQAIGLRRQQPENATPSR